MRDVVTAYTAKLLLIYAQLYKTIRYNEWTQNTISGCVIYIVNHVWLIYTATEF